MPRSISGLRVVALASVLLLPALGCGDDDFNPYAIVGGACRDAFDCAPGVDCERGGDFPDGTCTLPCRSHRDCPGGTACVDVRGGLCLIACTNDLHCRERYACRARDSRGERGESFVCID